MAALQKGFVRHPKFTALSDGAFRLWLAAWSYCQEQLTDGVIHRGALASLGVRLRSAWIRELLTVVPPYTDPLWQEQGDTYVMHDYLDWNDSREEIQEHRARLRTKVQAHRLRAKAVAGDGNGSTATGTSGATQAPRNPARTAASNRLQASAGNSLPTPTGNRLVTRGSTNNGTYVPPPTPPVAGGAVETVENRPRPPTRPERRRAETLRREAWCMRCRHDPPCATYDACITAIVQDLRATATQEPVPG